MNKPLISSAAERDFTEALCWYSERSQQAAEAFCDEFSHALRAIARDPERFPKCDQEHRYYLLRRYPFQVIYRSQGDHLLVVAVAHTKREPGFWNDR